jgi:hypothetical protein
LICAEHSPVAKDNPFNPVFFGFGIVQDLNWRWKNRWRFCCCG